MFLVAGTGRCGTRAICDALDRFTDHCVRHEPEPRLLAEAWRVLRSRFPIRSTRPGGWESTRTSPSPPRGGAATTTCG